MVVRCQHCNEMFDPGAGERTARCPICLRLSTAIEVGRARTLAPVGTATPKLFVVGIVMAAAGSVASQLGMAPSEPVAARSYRLTLGVITVIGFALAIAGGIQWWLRRRRVRERATGL
ncbi:MAG TPA: hypothetical protein VIU61_10375 [Kofleriaceae bacterium]